MKGHADPPKLIADAVVQADSTVLLVRLTDPPDSVDAWRLPGEELRHGEHPEACVRRVLKEFLRLEPEVLELAEIESLPGDLWRLVFHYRCEADRSPTPGGAVREARFFQVEHLPRTARGDWEREVIYRVIGA